MKKILTVIGLLFLMVACSSTEEVKSSGSREKIIEHQLIRKQ